MHKANYERDTKSTHDLVPSLDSPFRKAASRFLFLVYVRHPGSSKIELVSKNISINSSPYYPPFKVEKSNEPFFKITKYYYPIPFTTKFSNSFNITDI